MEFHKVSQINRTALDLAQSKGRQKMVELLSHTNQNSLANYRKRY